MLNRSLKNPKANFSVVLLDVLVSKSVSTLFDFQLF